jgi:hypothetical protein
MSAVFADGRTATAPLGHKGFASTSAIAMSTYLPILSLLHVRTTRGHDILIELPRPTELAPVAGRPVIYLDQNHWSTLANAIHQPERVANKEELGAATHLIELATRRRIVLPMSSAHMAETCKQADGEQRYRRALTLAQLSGGWQLRDPLDIRRLELRQALIGRYHGQRHVAPAAVTLEPDAAIRAGRHKSHCEVDPELSEEARWAVHVLGCVGGILDSMLDVGHVPVLPVPGWVADFQAFATFIAENPTGPEMKRRRTHAKFIADLGRELPEEAHRAAITPEQMSDWALNHSEDDLRQMPALGLFREVMHEKLCNGGLRWEQNDLVDMMYLTAAGGYCDYVVGERAHASHIRHGLRRLGRAGNIYSSLRTLVAVL